MDQSKIQPILFDTNVRKFAVTPDALRSYWKSKMAFFLD